MTCYLCGEEIEDGTNTFMRNGKLVTFCRKCGIEFNDRLEYLERSAKVWVNDKIGAWVRHQRVVKRFYRRQGVLPLDGGDE